jgi:hypothetical protein
MNPICRNPSFAAPTDGNLKVVLGGTGVNSTIVGTLPVSSGKWYFETVGTDLTGIVKTLPSDINTIQTNGNTEGIVLPDGYGYYKPSGNKTNNNVSSAYGASFTYSDTIGVAFDADAG